MKDSLPELPDDLQIQVTSLQTALVGLIKDSLESNTRIDNLAEQLKKMQVLHKQTDERLSELIIMVEKFLKN